MTTDDDRLLSDLEYLKVGSGPNFVLYNPFHLWFIDAPLSAARAVLKGEPTITPKGLPKAEVISVAKRRLRAGQELDGIGGYCAHGVIEKWEVAREEGLLPHGLTEDATLVRTVDKGQPLTYDDVQLGDSVLVELRKLQDALFK